jgi:hypothetical protein
MGAARAWAGAFDIGHRHQGGGLSLLPQRPQKLENLFV